MSNSVPIINGQKIVSLACAAVGGPNNKHILAKVSIIDFYGKVILDTFVSPEFIEVRNYRFEQSGIKQQDLIGAPSFSAVQKRVHEIIIDKIVVGHNLRFDFCILGITSRIKFMRDIGTNGFILKVYGNENKQQVSLKSLTKLILQRDIQVDCINSIENATAAMDIYKYYQMEIENGHLRDMKKDDFEIIDESYVRDIGMETESSNTLRNALIAGGIVVGGILAVTLSIFGNRSNNK